MRIKILPYKLYSAGAQAVAEGLSAALGYKVWRVRETYRPRARDLIINWGNPRCTLPMGKVINVGAAVGNAINKHTSFAMLHQAGVNIPEFTTNKEEAQRWADFGKTIIARRSLTGTRGHGIVVVEKGDVVPDALLYTVHTRHAKEYRVHVVNGRVIDVSEKRRRNDWQGEYSKLVRSARYGWVFCHENVDCPQEVKDEAIKAVAALGLTFGGVDIGYRIKENKAYVFEVNTAPGLEGQSIQKYVDALAPLVRG